MNASQERHSQTNPLISVSGRVILTEDRKQNNPRLKFIMSVFLDDVFKLLMTCSLDGVWHRNMVHVHVEYF